MDAEDRKKFTRLIISYFPSDELVCETALRKIPPTIIKEALEKGYIRFVRKNDIGKKLYQITELGKNFR